jgi:acyl-CoA thioesterase FadM
MDDLIAVSTKVNAIKKASIILDQEIYLEDILINKAKVTLAVIDWQKKKPVKIPQLIINTFSK